MESHDDTTSPLGDENMTNGNRKVRFAEEDLVKTYDVTTGAMTSSPARSVPSTPNKTNSINSASKKNMKSSPLLIVPSPISTVPASTSPPKSVIEQSSTPTITPIITNNPPINPITTIPTHNDSMNAELKQSSLTNTRGATKNKLKSCCRSLINGLFFTIFLTLFLIPLYLAVISPILFPSSPEVEVSDSIGSSSIPDPTATSDPTPTDSVQVTSTPSHSTSSSSGIGFLSFLYDIQRTVSSRQCGEVLKIDSQHAVTDSDITSIDFHKHSLPVTDILKALTFEDINNDIYTTTNALADETYQLLNYWTPHDPRLNMQSHRQQQRNMTNPWIKTGEEDNGFYAETVLASEMKQWQEREQIKVYKEREYHVCQTGDLSSDNCIPESEVDFVGVNSQSVKNNSSTSISTSSECRLLSRSLFNVSTIYTAEQVFQELVTSAGLEMLLSVHGKPKNRRDGESSSSSDDSDMHSAMSSRPIYSFEWFPGSIEVFYVPITSFVSFYRRELLVLKVIDRVRNLLIMKSITFPEISKMISSRHRKKRHNAPSIPITNGEVDSSSTTSTPSIHDTIYEIEREMDNLLELFHSYAISLGDKDMKSFITSLQQQIYRDITIVKEQMKDDNDDGEDEEDDDEDEDDEGNDSTNFFIALQLRPINSTTSSHTTTTTSDTDSNTNNGYNNNNNKDSQSIKNQKNDKKKKSGSSTDKTTTTTAASSSSVKSSSMINPDSLSLPPVLPLGVKYIHEISILRYEDNQQMFSWFVWFKEYVDQNIFFKNLHYKMLDYFDSPMSYIV